MFNFIHRLTYCPIRCKNREVHRLPKPGSLMKHGLAWTYHQLCLLRKYRLSVDRAEELKELSVPIPGLKDATIGLPLPSANPPCPLALSDTEEHTWVCSRCGRDMVTGIVGSSTPTTIPSQPGS